MNDLLDRKRGPEEANQFASDGNDDLVARLATIRHPTEASTQPVMSSVRDGDHACGLAFAALAKSGTASRRVTVVPCALDQNTPSVTVPALRDACVFSIFVCRLLRQESSGRNRDQARS